MPDSFYTQPPTYEKLIEAIDRLKARYGELKVFPIGKSVLGKDRPIAFRPIVPTSPAVQ